MAARHYGHRREVKEGLDGLGRHFLDVHGAGLDLSKKADLAMCLQDLSLVVIGSVGPPSTPGVEQTCRQRLDRLESRHAAPPALHA